MTSLFEDLVAHNIFLWKTMTLTKLLMKVVAQSVGAVNDNDQI